MHKDNGFFAQDGGYEYPAVLGLTAAALALSGPGRLSLDAALGHVANRHWMRAVALAAVPAAAGLVFRRRKTALAVAASTAPEDGTGSGDLTAPATADPLAPATNPL